jgi:hypothetical protein
MKQKTFYIILLIGFLCIMTLMSFASTDTTYITKDSTLVLKTINIELYKERVQNPNSFDKLYIYQRKDRFGYYKEFVFYKKLKN